MFKRLKAWDLFMVGLAVVCAAGVWMNVVSVPEHTVRIGLLGPVSDEDYDGALVLKDYVESHTQGSVKVQIYPSAQFCSNPRECIEGLKSGVLDVFMTTFGGMASVFPEVQVFELPYLFRDDDVAECVFDGPLIDEIRQKVLDAESGMRLMVVSNTGGWRNFATTQKLTNIPSELAGLKLRTTSSPMQIELVSQLDASPTPIPWSELYTALATGVVDGTKNSIQDIVSMNLHESLKYIVLDGHAYMGAMWWYSESRWKELSLEQRRTIANGFHRLKLVTRALPIRRQIEALQVFKEAGGSVYAPTSKQKTEFQAVAQSLRPWFIEHYGGVWLARVESIVKNCEFEVDKTTQAIVD